MMQGRAPSSTPPSTTPLTLKYFSSLLHLCLVGPGYAWAWGWYPKHVPCPGEVVVAPEARISPSALSGHHAHLGGLRLLREDLSGGDPDPINPDGEGTTTTNPGRTGTNGKALGGKGVRGGRAEAQVPLSGGLLW